MKSSNVIITALLILLALGLAVILKFPKEKASSRPPQPSETKRDLTVTAQNNQLNPQNFKLLHLETLNLQIRAVDRDYVFALPDFNLNVSLPQGETTSVNLVGEGVGTYEYTCGQNCSGSVEVSPEPDVDD